MPWMMLVTVVAVALVMALMPRVTRPDVFFGATVEPAFRRSPEGRRIERNYLLWVLLSTAIAGALCAVAPALTFLPLIAGSVAGWVLGHRSARRHSRAPEPVREVSLARRKLPRGLVAAAIGPLLILGAAAWYIHLNWDLIPERIPVHYGLNGPNRWADKSPSSVYGILGMGVSVCVTMLISMWMVAGARRIAVTGAAGERDSRYRNFTLWLLVAVGYMIALMFAGITAGSAFAPEALSGTWLPVLAVAPIILVVAGLLYFAKLTAERDSGPVIGDRTPDENWVWGGLFYWNRNDPALVVEKRFGFGYTLNMAHPSAWVLLGALLAPALIATVVSRID